MAYQPISKQVDGDRLVILQRGSGVIWEAEFFYEIEKAILDGYTFPLETLNKDKSRVRFAGNQAKAVMFKKKPKVEVKAPVVEPKKVETPVAKKPTKTKTSK